MAKERSTTNLLERSIGERQCCEHRYALHRRLCNQQRANEADQDQHHAQRADPFAEQVGGGQQHHQRRDLSQRGRIGDRHVGQRDDEAEHAEQFEQVAHQYARLEQQRQMANVAEGEDQWHAPQHGRDTAQE